MRSKNKRLISKVLVGILILVGFTIYGFSFICHNGAGGVYGSGSSTGSSTGGGEINSISIEDYIVEGGGYYLKANSAIQTLLQMVEWQEMQGMDYNEFQHVLDKSISNMHSAIFAYQQLIIKAEATPYNEDMLKKLEEFDYPAFMENNRLNPYIFGEVEGYLKYGDITDIFSRTYFNFIDIVNRLYLIDAGVTQNSLPDITVFRELNEIAANLSTFGSYTARVFSNI
jgi:hypothetical protein